MAVSLLVSGCFQDAGSDTSTDTTAATETGGGDEMCDDYCSVIQESCTGENQQYTSELACKQLCEFMDAGEEGIGAGNTVACRVTWALEVPETPMEMRPAVCRQAGPGGDGVCGGNCESLCALTREICVDDSQQWASDTECITECNALDTDPPYSTGVESGNSVACRLYHLNLATSNPLTHCGHVGGDAPCTP